MSTDSKSEISSGMREDLKSEISNSSSRGTGGQAPVAWLSTTLMVMVLILGAIPHVASGKPTAGDVFKSIQDNVGDSSDESLRSALPWICAAGGLVILLAIFSKRQTRQSSPPPLNNPNRLAREVLKSMPLKPREYKQVKIVADETPIGDDRTVCSPLVLLLCPSVLLKAARNRDTRADRQVLLQILKRLEIRPSDKPKV